MVRTLSVLLCVAVVPLVARGEETKPYPEAKHGKGELRYVNGLPVLVVQGTPEEIGEQFGILAVKHATPLLNAAPAYMKKIGLEKSYPLMLRASGLLINSFPEAQRKEIEAAAKASGVEKNLVTMTNAFPDLMKIGGCSTLIVEPDRSKTKSVIFGRLLDWPPFEGVPEHSLVVIVRAEKKHACALVTIPPILGCISGMNDVGLCISMNEIRESKDQSSKIDFAGTPTLALMRKVLEECTTVDQAEKMIKDSKRMIWCCMTVCDAKGGCILEVTPKNVIRRNGNQGLCCCTNHFRTEELCVSDKCKRYSLLQKLQNGEGKLGVEEVGKELHKVSQKEYTIHAIVFEPAERAMSVAFGVGKSATESPLKRIDCATMFQKGFAK